MNKFTKALTNSDDSFKDPILAALRDRKYVESTDVFVEKGRRIYFRGDWADLKCSSGNANKLKDTLVKCLKAQDIEPKNAEVLPFEMSKTLHDLIPDDHGRIECIIVLDFNMRKYDIDTLRGALDKIITASRELQSQGKQTEHWIN